MSLEDKVRFLTITIILFIFVLFFFLGVTFINYNAGRINMFKNDTDYNTKLSIVILVVVSIILILLITGFVLLLMAENEHNDHKKKKLKKQAQIILIFASVFAVLWFGVFYIASSAQSKKE